MNEPLSSETSAMWAEADAAYEKDVAAIEANMDRRDISCQDYQRMRIHANRNAGLEHGPHCKQNSCICGGFPFGKCIHGVSVEKPCNGRGCDR